MCPYLESFSLTISVVIYYCFYYEWITKYHTHTLAALRSSVLHQSPSAKWRNSPTPIPPNPYHPLPQPTQSSHMPQRLGQQNVQPTSSPFAYPPPPLYPPTSYTPPSQPLTLHSPPNRWRGNTTADWRWCRLCGTVKRRLGRMMSW